MQASFDTPILARQLVLISIGAIRSGVDGQNQQLGTLPNLRQIRLSIERQIAVGVARGDVVIEVCGPIGPVPQLFGQIHHRREVVCDKGTNNRRTSQSVTAAHIRNHRSGEVQKCISSARTITASRTNAILRVRGFIRPRMSFFCSDNTHFRPIWSVIYHFSL